MSHSEGIPNITETPSVDDIKAKSGALKQRLADLVEARKRETRDQVFAHEDLRNDSRSIHDSIGETEKIVSEMQTQMDSLHELGISDESAEQLFTEAQETLNNLHNQAAEIDRKSQAIYENPAVKGALEDQAGVMEAEKNEQEAETEIAEKIKQEMARVSSLFDDIPAEYLSMEKNKYDKLAIVNEQLGVYSNYIRETSNNLGIDIASMFKQLGSEEATKAYLEVEKKKLGLFDRAKKANFDKAIQNIPVLNERAQMSIEHDMATDMFNNNMHLWPTMSEILDKLKQLEGVLNDSLLSGELKEKIKAKDIRAALTAKSYEVNDRVGKDQLFYNKFLTLMNKEGLGDLV